jgi:cyclopropane fatty-acyl-phospholipid synthase-like methyltransferase
MTGKTARSLREDFCGTSRISMDWVRAGKDRTATGLDLDPEPLSYFERVHAPTLTEDQRRRIRHEQKNVLVATRQKFDLIAACNFSFFIFKERKTLLQYFRAARASLAPKGALFLEMAGGEGMQEWLQEERTIRVPGVGRVRYVWDQMDYDAISGVNDYAIHFQLPNRRWMKNAFEYHWRLWGIREIREILAEAGFKKTHVFWEVADSSGRGTGEYAPMEKGDPAHAWIAYVAGIR